MGDARLQDLVSVSEAVRAEPGRRAKSARLAALLRTLDPDSADIAVALLCGAPRQGRLGIGPRALEEARRSAAASEPRLSLRDVDRAFDEIARDSGPGSPARRITRLCALLEAATGAEQDFLVRVLFGELRQGAVEGVLGDAVAEATGIEPERVRRAAMLTGSIEQAARVALTQGRSGLDACLVQPLRPVAPMLAEPADDVDEALAELGPMALEWKLDGARIQAHKDGDRVEIYSRALRPMTAALPEVVTIVEALPARSLVLDGEIIALRPDGSPHPFQVTARRFGRSDDLTKIRAELPLSTFFFDCLLVDGTPFIDEPQRRRFDALRELVPSNTLVPHLIDPEPHAVARFVEDALSRGHEGVMAKSLDAPYTAGRRGRSWRKIKRPRTLDLVVLAAEWGSGRRRGWLSNLHLGARDPARGGFVMLGKTFKGLTDALLTWQTSELLAREIARDRYTVFVRPELVVEIAFNDVQASPQYPGGVALRFARVKRYRPDKSAAEADTIETVLEEYRRATGLPLSGAGSGQ